MKYFVIFLVLVGLFTSSAFAFEPSWTNYFTNPEFKIYKVQENAYEFSIPYKISDAKLDRIVVDCGSRELIIYLDAVATENNLTINIPRDLLDSKVNDQDDYFFVMIDQHETEYQETSTDPDSRTLYIPLRPDSRTVEIFATSLVSLSPCGVGGDDESPYYRLLSPLKQFNSGIPFNEIQCNQNLVLLQKYDDSPACVTEQTKQKLIERGWTTKDSSAQKIIDEITTPKYGTAEFDTEYHKARQIYLDVRKPMDLPFIGLTIDSTEKHVVLGINSDKLTAEKDKTYYRQLGDELFKDVNLNIMIHYKNTTGLIFDE